ncbi:MAG: hypothetical protein WB443_11455 [Nitrososphaeraceae archaeon]
MSKENSKNSLKHKKRKSEDVQKEDNNDDQTLWASIARNYEMIQGAHIRRSIQAFCYIEGLFRI